MKPSVDSAYAAWRAATQQLSDARTALESAISEELSARMVLLEHVIGTSTLSPRLREVYTLIVRDKSNKEIADALNISVHTVKYHVNDLFRTLGVNSRKGLLLKKEPHETQTQLGSSSTRLGIVSAAG